VPEAVPYIRKCNTVDPFADSLASGDCPEYADIVLKSLRPIEYEITGFRGSLSGAYVEGFLELDAKTPYMDPRYYTIVDRRIDMGISGRVAKCAVYKVDSAYDRYLASLEGVDRLYLARLVGNIRASRGEIIGTSLGYSTRKYAKSHMAQGVSVSPTVKQISIFHSIVPKHASEKGGKIEIQDVSGVIHTFRAGRDYHYSVSNRRESFMRFKDSGTQYVVFANRPRRLRYLILKS